MKISSLALLTLLLCLSCADNSDSVLTEDTEQTAADAVISADGESPSDVDMADTGTTPDVQPLDAGMDIDMDEDMVTEDAGWTPDTVVNPPQPVFVPSSPQRDGDAEAGYEYLLEGSYVGCGLPAKMYDLASSVGFGMGDPPAPGSDTELSYFLSAYTTWEGVKVVAPNCLTCHADLVHGQVVLGLGATKLNYSSIGDQMTLFDEATIASLADQFGFSPEEKEELIRFTNRFKTVLPYIEPSTIGVSSADNLAAILFAHRDPETLAWSDEPLMDPPGIDVVPIDVPAWWLMKKKNAMFHNAGGKGDHARIMMTASTLCVDSVEEAEAIDEKMPDLRAFVLSLEPPEYYLEIDQALADEGRVVFEDNCSVCHGTYGEEETYPNLVVPLEVIGTDPMAAAGASQFAGPFVDWFNNSFYGEISLLDPFEGYVPPPLDGVWVTAPYFHNGSVPHIAAVLDSTARPTYWRRVYEEDAYDEERVGWLVEDLDGGKDTVESEEEKYLIYDTTLPGYGNGGHPFGDDLSEEERLSVIEYLKTL